MQFRVFKQVPRLIFGRKSIERLAELLPADISEGYVQFVIDDSVKNQKILDGLPIRSNDQVLWFNASAHEPKTSQIDEIRDGIVASGRGLPKAVVGVGGGATMDVAKAISVMLKNEGSSTLYQGWDLVKNPGIFKVGIPTISGSGSEASRTAVLTGKDKKFGINSDFSMFDGVIMDPDLTANVPKDQRFYTAMDCYIHSVEAMSGTMIHPLANAYADRGLQLSRGVYLADGTDDDLMAASFMGGASVVNSEVGVCHALSYGLSLELGYRHGFANCVAFNVLDEYYGKYVEEFRMMVDKHKITLPKKATASLSKEAIDRMVQMTLRMERPLTNALGPNWKEKMTPEKIIDLYSRM